MKTILLETVSIIKVTLFWAIALPVAALLFPAISVWQKIGKFGSHGGPTGPATVLGSGLTPATR
jgi:hypothetical protein